MTTMKDVADAAGVSVATVSRVLNKNSIVSADLRERVEKAMTELDYRPSRLARSLRLKETQTIAVLVPQLDQPFFGALTFAVQQTLFESGYHTLTVSTVESATIEESTVDMLLGQLVDGVIAVPISQDVARLDMPLVLVDRDMDLPRKEVDRVRIDNFGGAHTAATHLLELGHRRIAIIGGPSHSPPIMQRIRGAQAALSEYGITGHTYMLEGWHGGNLQRFGPGYKTAHRILSGEQRPTAVFALMDSTAIVVMQAARDLGLRIPDDLSVVGFDNIPLAEYLNLTTVSQPIHAMGEAAANAMLHRLQQPADSPLDPQTITLETQLIVRETTQRHIDG